MNSKGYCHRDLKPWNIMFNNDLSALKIIDFGYATPINEEEFSKSPSYLKGKLSGTVNYMAPELNLPEIDFSLAKADVFALGVILFNLLTGTFPFSSVKDPQYGIFCSNPIVTL